MGDKTIVRTAQVIDDNDPELVGRVQVRIFPEMADVEDNHLPWAKPWNAGSHGVGDETGSHNPPEIDSWVKVRVADEYWTKFYYEPHGSYVQGKYIYEKIEEIDIDEIDNFKYPQPRFFRTQDGTVYFHNTENGDCGIKHSSGAYLVMDTDGGLFFENDDTKISVPHDDDIEVTSGGKILIESGDDTVIDTGGVTMSIKAGGEVEIDATKVFVTGDLQVSGGSDAVSLFMPLSEILIKLLSHKHTAPTGPCTPAEEASGTPLAAYIADVFDIRSMVNTTD